MENGPPCRPSYTLLQCLHIAQQWHKRQWTACITQIKLNDVPYNRNFRLCRGVLMAVVVGVFDARSGQRRLDPRDQECHTVARASRTPGLDNANRSTWPGMPHCGTGIQDARSGQCESIHVTRNAMLWHGHPGRPVWTTRIDPRDQECHTVARASRTPGLDNADWIHVTRNATLWHGRPGRPLWTAQIDEREFLLSQQCIMSIQDARHSLSVIEHSRT